MAAPKYQTDEYKHARAAWAQVIASVGAPCMQRDPWQPGSAPGTGCVIPGRWITAGTTRWQLAHDETGTIIDGPAHTRCNARDGAVRGNRSRNTRRRWVL